MEATWRQRTEADYVRADKDARGVAEWDDCLPPIFSGLVLSAALRKLGVATVQADEDADGAVVGIAREKNGMVVSRDSDLMLMDSCGYIDMPQFFEYGLQREDPRGPKLLTPVFHPGTPPPSIPGFNLCISMRNHNAFSEPLKKWMFLLLPQLLPFLCLLSANWSTWMWIKNTAELSTELKQHIITQPSR